MTTGYFPYPRAHVWFFHALVLLCAVIAAYAVPQGVAAGRAAERATARAGQTAGDRWFTEPAGRTPGRVVLRVPPPGPVAPFALPPVVVEAPPAPLPTAGPALPPPAPPPPPPPPPPVDRRPAPQAPPPAPSGRLVVRDADGVDLAPLVLAAARANDVPAVALFALLHAESDLHPRAARVGAWPDVSFGLGQMTVATAGLYGLGDGTPASTARVRGALSDRKTAIDLAARHLRHGFARARAAYPGVPDDALALHAMVVYNAGSLPPGDDPWWEDWADNVARMRRSLAWAWSLPVR